MLDLSPREQVFELKWTPAGATREEKVLVGWGGASCDQNVIEIPAPFAAALRLEKGTPVTVVHRTDIPPATQVFVEPASSDDWEILEANAEMLESELLNCVSVVSEGETFPFIVRQNLQIRIRVAKALPAASGVRLVIDSEVIIAPKPRQLPQTPAAAPPAAAAVLPPLPPRTLRIQTLRPHAITSPPTPEIYATPGVPLAGAAYVSPASLREFGWTAGMVVALSLPPASKAAAKASPNPVSASGSALQSEPPKQQQLPRRVLDSHQPAPATKPDPLPKTFAFVQIFPSTVAHKHHVLLSRTLLDELQAKEFTKALVTPVQHNAELPGTLSLRAVTWSAPNQTAPTSTTLPAAPAVVLQAFKQWLHVQTQAGARPVPASSHMIVSLPLANGNADYALFISPALSSTPGSAQTPATAGVAAHSFFLLSPKNVPPSIDVDPAVVFTRPELDEDAPELTKISGLSKQIERITEHIESVVFANRYFSSPSANVCVAIHGASGSGKTFLVRSIAQHCRTTLFCYSLVLPCRTFASESAEKVRARLRESINECQQHSPALLVLDDLDAVLPAEAQEQHPADSARAQQLAELLVDSIADARGNTAKPVVFVATFQSPESLHRSVRVASGLFEQPMVALPAPDRATRRELLEKLLASAVPSMGAQNAPLDLEPVARTTEGYVPADLASLVKRAVHAASVRVCSSLGAVGAVPPTLHVTAEDLAAAQRDYTPISLQGVTLQKSETTWNDIGGLEEVRATLKETIEWPTKYARLFASCSLRVRQGLLLYGPPGCGKTLLASAVARECGLNFVSVKGPELLNKYIGASEQGVRDVFARAQAARPCVLFFDEFDSIAPKRGHDSTGVTDRVVNQFLTQLDGVEALTGVYVLAATSRPDLIDAALLRPGRLDRCLHCGMPSRTERISILKALSRKMHIAPSVDWETIADLCEGRSGADLQAVLYNAQLAAVHEVLDAPVAKPVTGSSSSNTERASMPVVMSPQPLTADQQASLRNRAETAREFWATGGVAARLLGEAQKGPQTEVKASSTPRITMQHLRQSIESTPPSLSEADRARYQQIYDDFLDARGDFNAKQPEGFGKRTTLG
eukprot:TRINITY_DN8496_c0_g1_i2.p1 TRINITY_DN8496_c0_g1~~TRINITY_DN8496_c0_g1_i2.p1  ORF type:complete len:1093 (-),score=227.60 TRINITY_DN8496_c0_g1_i2:38-3316(-)